MGRAKPALLYYSLCLLCVSVVTVPRRVWCLCILQRIEEQTDMVVGELTQETDLLIIGGGPGGYTAAFRAAELGVKTTVVEARQAGLGGVCLHEGCIPSKTLLTAAELIALPEHAEPFGIKFDKPTIELNKLREWKNQVVGKLVGGLDGQAKKFKIERVAGYAHFEDSHCVVVQGEHNTRIKFRKAIIATGSESIRLKGIEIDSPRIMHSSGALALADIPQNLLVIGGGYIGLELGSVYARLGSEVTVVEMMDSLLPGADGDLVRPLAKTLGGVLKEICLKTKVTAMTEEKNGLKITFDSDQPPGRDTFEKVLVCVGRRPRSDNLGLDKTKVKVNHRGFIEVDEQRRTSDERIFAIGDVVPGPMLAHKAAAEGKIAAEVIAGQHSTFDARAIPAVVFTDPEVAWCGLTANEAKESGRKVVVKKMPWGACGRAVSMGRANGMTKILFDGDTQQVLGVGMVGVHAGEMIAEGVLALEMGAVAADLAGTIHPHPTLSEMMGEAANLMAITTKMAKNG